MENRSFGEILNELLEEETHDSPLKNTNPHFPSTGFSSDLPLFTWQNPNLKAKKNLYPSPAPKAARLAATVSPMETEVFYAVKRLELPDQLRVQVLERMGASEFCEGISLKKLKKAHRRLVKRLHPDGLDANLTDCEKRRAVSQFLLLQEAYEGLQRALGRLKDQSSDSTRDNESASAPTCRRQDAA